LRTALIALLLSTLIQVWITYATAWEVINSKLQFLAWPGLAAAMLLQAVLPESITVQHDPLPHPAVLWTALVANFVAWAALFWLVMTASKTWLRRRREAG
jgi:hypothetical protein